MKRTNRIKIALLLLLVSLLLIYSCDAMDANLAIKAGLIEEDTSACDEAVKQADKVEATKIDSSTTITSLLNKVDPDLATYIAKVAKTTTDTPVTTALENIGVTSIDSFVLPMSGDDAKAFNESVTNLVSNSSASNAAKEELSKAATDTQAEAVKSTASVASALLDKIDTTSLDEDVVANITAIKESLTKTANAENGSVTKGDVMQIQMVMNAMTTIVDATDVLKSSTDTIKKTITKDDGTTEEIEKTKTEVLGEAINIVTNINQVSKIAGDSAVDLSGLSDLINSFGTNL